MTGFRKRKERNKVMRDRRLGIKDTAAKVDCRTLAKAPGPVAKLLGLDAELAKSVQADEPVLREVKKNLAAATIAEVREGKALADSLARALMVKGFSNDQSVLWAAQAVHAANVADRRTARRRVNRPKFASLGEDYGYDDAFVMIDWAIDHGQSIEQGVENHRAYREVGDLFTAEHGDEAGFHRGAEAAYTAIRRAYEVGA